MAANTENYQLDRELTLLDSSESPLTVNGVNLLLTKQNDKIGECRFIVQVSPKLYQHIDSKTLFNLKPEIRSPLSNGSFQTSTNIQIEATLDPKLLPQLAQHASNPQQAAAYLQKLSQEQPNHPILSTYSWYGLEVKQQQERGETGYRTIWAYLKPSSITEQGIDSEKMNEAMLNFAKEWANNNDSGISQDAITQAVEEMTQTFEELTNSVSVMTQEMVSETVEEMTNAFEELTQSIAEITEEIASQGSILEAMVSFFTSEEWPFQQLPGESTLRLAFQGKNGKWNCYARAREEQQQFVFYSICPVKAPTSQLAALGEFVCRANFGIIIGNFELDFTSGEIRYKTSIDAKGGLFTEETFKQLVYTNVLTMDRYLPGIQSLISGENSPEQAIAQVEQIGISLK